MLTSHSEAAVYVSVESSLGAAVAVRTALEKSGNHVKVVVEPKILEVSRGLIPDAMALSQSRRVRLINRVQGLLVQSLTSLVLGDNRRNRDTFAPTGRAARSASTVLRLLPRCSPRALNRSANRIGRWFVPDVLGVDCVYAIAPVATPIVLNRRGLDVAVVLDSWDQPVRRTAGFWADTVFAWNSDLANDWRSIQGAHSVGTIPAYRLAYALDSGRRAEASDHMGARTVLYPVATSPNRPAWYSSELQLVRTLCEATEAAGFNLLLKPKPNSSPGDLERLVSGFSHVRIGTYLSSEVTSDWLITDQYNDARLAELDAAWCVVSTVTTFALDAATAGVPVLQLDLRGVTELGAFADAAHNAHLVRHLYDTTSAGLTPPTTLGEVFDLVSRIGSLEDRMRAASASLAAWIWSTRSSEIDPDFHTA